MFECEGTKNISYVDVKDSDARRSSSQILPTTSIDSGNTLYWFLPSLYVWDSDGANIASTDASWNNDAAPDSAGYCAVDTTNDSIDWDLNSIAELTANGNFTGTITQSVDLDITQLLNIQVGTWDMSGQTLDTTNLIVGNNGTFDTGSSDLTINQSLSMTDASVISGTGTVFFYAADADNTVSGGTITDDVIISTTGATTWTLEGNLTIVGDLTIKSGATFDLDTYDLSVSGIVTIEGTMDASGSSEVWFGDDVDSSSGTYTTGSETVFLYSGNAATITIDEDLYDVTVQKSGGTATLTEHTNITNNLTLNLGTLDGASYDLTVGGNLDLNTTLDGSDAGSDIFVSGNWDSTGGTFTYGSGTVWFYGTGNSTVTMEDEQFNDVYVNKTSGGATQNMTVSDLLKINGDLLVQDGIFFTNSELTMNGNLIVSSGAAFTSLGQDETIFFNDSAAVSYQINAGGTITLQGTSGNELKLRSDSTGNQWDFIQLGTKNISYVDVKDSDALASSAPILPTTSIDSGNNLYWFLPTHYIWDSGGGNNNASTVDNWDENQAPSTGHYVTIDNYGDAITWNIATTLAELTVNGSFTGSTTQSVDLGVTDLLNLQLRTWDMNGQELSTSNLVVGSAATLDTSTEDLTIGQSLSMTNASVISGTGAVFFYANDADNTVSGGTITDDVIITTDGATTWTLEDTLTIVGDLTIRSGATLDLDAYDLTVTGAVVIEGTLDASSSSEVWFGGNLSSGATGTYTGGTETVYFYGAGPLSIAVGGTLGAIEIDKGSNTTTLGASLQTNGAVTLNAGTLDVGAYDLTVGGNFVVTGTVDGSDAASDIYVGGNWDMTSCTFSYGAGRVWFYGTTDSTVTMANEQFNDVYVNKSSAGVTQNVTISDLLQINGDLLVQDGIFFTNSELTLNGNMTVSSGANFTSLAENETLFFNDSDLVGYWINAGGSITLNGTIGNEIKLRSDSDGNQWDFYLLGSRTMNYVNVKDSDARGGNLVNPFNSTDVSNNDNWFANLFVWDSDGANTASTAVSWNNDQKPVNGGLVAIDTTNDSIDWDLLVNLAELTASGGFGGEVTQSTNLSVNGLFNVQTGEWYIDTYELQVKDLVIASGARVDTDTGDLTVTQSVDLGSGAILGVGTGEIFLYAADVDNTVSGGTFTDNVIITTTGSTTWTLEGDLTILGNLTIKSGATLDLDTYDLTVTGAVVIDGTLDASSSSDVWFGDDVNGSSGTYTGGSETAHFYNTGAISLSSGGTFGAIEFDKGANTITMGSSIETTNGITLTSGTLDVGAYDLTVGGNLDINSTLDGSDAAADIFVGGNFDATGGTFTYGSGAVWFYGTGNSTVTMADEQFNDVYVRKTTAGATQNMTVSDLLKINGDLLVQDGIFFTNSELTLNGNLTVSSGAAFTSLGANETIFFNDANTVGYWINAGATITLQGTGVNDLYLRSDSDSNTWDFFQLGTKNISYVDVKDSDASYSSSVISPTTSTDSGNNIYWFPATRYIWDSGGGDNNASTAFNWDNNQSPSTGHYVTIDDYADAITWDIATALAELTVNGSFSGSTTQTADLYLTGLMNLQQQTWDMNGQELSASDLVIGNAATVDTSTNDLTIGQSLSMTDASVISGTGTIFFYANDADNTVSGGTITDDVIITTTGATTWTLEDNLTIVGDLTIKSGATFDLDNYDLSVSGIVTIEGVMDASGSNEIWFGDDVDSSSGTYTPGTAAVFFYSANAATITIDETLNAVTVNKGAETATLANTLNASGAVTITSGTLDIDTYDLTVGGVFDIDGTVDASSAGEIWCGDDVNSSTGTYTTGTETIFLYDTNAATITIDEDIYDITVQKGGGNTATLANTLNATGAMTLTSGTLDIDTYDLTVAGIVDIDGTMDASSAGEVWFGDDVNTADGTYTVGSETVFLYSNNAATITIDETLNAVTVDKGATATLANTLHTSGAVTITSGTLDIDTYDLTVGGILDIDGTVDASSAGEVWCGDDVNSSTGTYTTGTETMFLYDTNIATITIDEDLYDVILQKTGSSATLAEHTNITNNLTLDVGSLDGDTYDLTVGGNLDLNTTLDGGDASCDIFVAGNWDSTGGTFTYGSGRVWFYGSANSTVTMADEQFATLYINKDAVSDNVTISDLLKVNSDLLVQGGTFFTNSELTMNANLTVSSGAAFTSLGEDETIFFNNSDLVGYWINAGATVTWRGTSGNELKLRSDSNTNQWDFFQLGTKNISFVNVKDSYALGSSAPIAPTNSIDAGNNIYWFAPTLYVWDSGGGDNFASTDFNWDQNQAPAGSGRYIVFDDYADAVTWDIAATFTELTVNGSFTGSITQTADLYLTDLMNLQVQSWDMNGQELSVSDLVIGNGASVDTSTEDLTIGQSLSMTNLSTISGTGAVFFYANDADNTVSGGTITDDVIITTTGATTWTLEDNLTIVGDLTIKSGATFDLDAYDLTVTGAVVIDGTLDASASSEVWFGGNLSGASGTYTGGTETVHFYNNGALSIAIGGTLGAIEIDKGANTTTLGSSLATNGAVMLNAGTIDVGAYDLTVGGNFVVNGTVDGSDAACDIYVGANWDMTNCTFTYGAGRVWFYGTTDSTVTMSDEQFNDLYVNKSSAGVTQNVTISDLLQINGDLLVQDGIFFTNSELTLNGNMTVSSGANFTSLGEDETLFFNDSDLIGYWINAGGSITLRGSLGNEVHLRSDSDGNQWDFYLMGTRSMNYISVKDGDATGGQLVNPYNSLDIDNNDNWFANLFVWDSEAGDFIASTDLNWNNDQKPVEGCLVSIDSTTNQINWDILVRLAELSTSGNFDGQITQSTNLSVSNRFTVEKGEWNIGTKELQIPNLRVLNDGRLDTDTGDLTVTQSVFLESGGILGVGTGEIFLSATDADNTVSGGTFTDNVFMTTTGASTWTLEGDLTIVGNLIIRSGVTLDLDTYDLSVSGIVTIEGEIDASSSGEVWFGNNVDSSSGTYTSGTETMFLYSANGGTVTIDEDLYDVVVQKTGGSVTLANDANITNNFTLNVGNVDADTYDLTVGGNLDINTTLDGGDASCDIFVAGNFDATGGTFTYGSGTVWFYGTGNSTVTMDDEQFNDVYVRKTAAGVTQNMTVSDLLKINGDLQVLDGIFFTNDELTLNGNLTVSSGAEFTSLGANETIFFNDANTVGYWINAGATVTLQGTGANDLYLRSDSDGNQWDFFQLGTKNISFVDVKDSDATYSSAVINPTSSTDSGNNIYWFVPSHYVWDSGGSDNAASTRFNWDNNQSPSTGHYVSIATSGDAITWDIATTLAELTIDGNFAGSTTQTQDLYSTGLINLQLQTWDMNGRELSASDLVIGNAATVDTSTNDLTIGQSLSMTNLSTISGTGTVFFYANDADNTISGGTITDDVIITTDGATTWTLEDNLTIVGDLTIKSGATFDLDTYDLSVSGIVTIEGGMDASSSSEVWFGDDVNSSSGTYTAGSETLFLYSANAATITIDEPVNGVTVQKGAGTATLANSLSVAGAMTVTSGTLDIDTYDLTVAGVVDIDGTIDASSAGEVWFGDDVNSSTGTYTLGTETMFLYSTNAATITIDEDIYDITIQKGGGNTATLANTLNATGAMTLTSGTLDIDTYDLTVAGIVDIDSTMDASSAGEVWFGDDVNTAGGTYTAGSETVFLYSNNAATITIDETLNIVTVDKGATTTLANTLHTSGAMTITSGTLDLDTYDLTVGGILDIDGTVDASSAGEVWCGDDVNSSTGTYTTGTETMFLYDTNVATITIDEDLYDVILQKTGSSATLANDTNITNDLTLAVGNIDADTYDLTVGGNLDINTTLDGGDASCDLFVGGDFDATGGTFTYGSGTVWFYGTGDSTVTMADEQFNDVYVRKTSAGVTQNMTVSDLLKINGDLLVQNGIFFTNSELTLNGNLTVSSGAEFTSLGANETIFFNNSDLVAYWINAGATVTWRGTSGNELKLRSDSNNNQWYFYQLGTKNISFVNVKDSDATYSSARVTETSQSIESFVE
ncbi:beta strand repeat-containing protein [Candidatus Omnitrophota bacterium]